MTDDPAPADDDVLELPGARRLRRCRHGYMVYGTNDTHVGRALDVYGEWAEAELELLGLLLRPGDTVVDVGANIGTHTVFFAGRVGERGRVVAFEPQRTVFQTLCANVTLNGFTHVDARWAAVGAAPGETRIPELDPSLVTNVGAARTSEDPRDARVPVVPLDALDLEACRLVKIDVEGMERDVIEGAASLLARTQPVLYVENNRRDRSAALVTALEAHGYTLFWHFTRYYNPRNFLGREGDVFGGLVEANMLGVVGEAVALFDGAFPRVLGPSDDADAAFARLQRGVPVR